MEERLVIFTIGHSTQTLEAFVEALRSQGVRGVVDVRTVPRSRHNPQFNGETLGPALRRRRIGYRQMKELGGLRHSRSDSINTGWHNLSFRGFADYMETAAFTAGLEALIASAAERLTAIMCAEALPWRCHRSLIADALLVRGIRVEHIIGPRSLKTHSLTAMARVVGQVVTYPAEEGQEQAEA